MLVVVRLGRRRVTLLGLRPLGPSPELQPFEHYAALISRILNLSVPRGAETSTVSPFLWPMMALPTGDSFDSLLAAGSASAEPTMWYSIVSFAATSRSFTCEPTDTTSLAMSFLEMTRASRSRSEERRVGKEWREG